MTQRHINVEKIRCLGDKKNYRVDEKKEGSEEYKGLTEDLSIVQHIKNNNMTSCYIGNDKKGDRRIPPNLPFKQTST